MAYYGDILEDACKLCCGSAPPFHDYTACDQCPIFILYQASSSATQGKCGMEAEGRQHG